MSDEDSYGNDEFRSGLSMSISIAPALIKDLDATGLHQV